MGILGGGAPPAAPAADVWKDLSFLQRLDHAAKDVSLNGRGLPAAVYAFHFATWFLNYSVLLLLVWAAGRPAEMGDVEYGMQTFVKCTVWHHLLEAVGFSRQGPMVGCFDGPTNFRYRLAPGTIKESLFSCLGNRRTYLDAALHAAFFAACAATVVLPKVPIALIRTIFALDAWFVVSDFQQWMASVGHTYMHMLFPACFALADGTLPGMQALMIIQWVSSGVGKVGPWFSNVNGPFMIQSPWMRGTRWFHRLLFKSSENLAPTRGAALFASFAAWVEWFCPLLLCASALPCCVGPRADLAVGLGIAGLLAMHVYIVWMPAPFDVFQWNTYFAITCVYLFWYASWGLDGPGLLAMHPLLVLYLCVELCVVVAGHFLPDYISFYVTHRYWAGNWAQAYFLVRKGAEGKLAGLRSFGSPAWDPLPAAMKARADPMTMQYGAAKGLGYMWLATYNMKIFPAVYRRALCGSPDADYQLVNGMALANMFQGQTTDMMRALSLTETLGKLCDLAEGDLRCIFIQSFPLLSKETGWKVVDARAGVVASGRFTTRDVEAVSGLPSACEKLASILS